MIQALSKQRFRTTNLADSQDTQILAEILKNETHGEHHQALQKLGVEVTYYTGPGGTTIRFLTAFFAMREGVRILSGSERMNERPIRPLVDALNALGARITYLGKEGCPPLRIEGKKLKGGDLDVSSDVSSQFITSLLLIAPALEDGLRLHLKGPTVSRSYIKMTLKVLEHFGIKTSWEGNTISIPHQEFQGWDYHIESDWSSASYWYEMAALADEADIRIRGLRRKSIQGDSVVADLFQFFGVNTEFTEDGIRIKKSGYMSEAVGFDFSDYPDIAQTAGVTAAALNIPLQMNGLETLRVKETDRIEALSAELKKIGANTSANGPANLEIKRSDKKWEANDDLPFKTPSFETYHDHRMAMAFAPLALILPEIRIQDPKVVSKSYPDFWNDLKGMGFEIKEEN